MELSDLNLSGLNLVLGIGLVITLFLWLSSLWNRSTMRKEIEDMKKHLHINMSIHAKGTQEMTREVEKLKKENENLRITVSTLSNKPGRGELKMLHTWDRAIKILTLKSPAFAPTWEMAIEEAKKELEETHSGVKALARKVFFLLPQESMGEN